MLGNKPEAVVKPVVKKKAEQKAPEKKSKEELSLKKKAVEAFELPGIQTETPPKVP